MPSSVGPKLSGKENLILALDTHDFFNGITPLGCGGFNGSNQGVKNLLNNSIYNFSNGNFLTGKNYFTGFAIDYPEWTFGGDAAGMQGLTPGYNVRGGSKLYDASRALHLWVYNNDTNSWIDNGAVTYFRGVRLSGHCYDNFTGAETGYLNEITKFIEDYNIIKSNFPNCTYIVAGSHRADQYTSVLRTILYDLGMPTGYLDSDYIAAPEWILVGKPGLGTGNAYGWVYENYTTDPTKVAHINFGLPIKSKGGIYFDGTDDYIAVTNPSDYRMGVNSFTLECIAKQGKTSIHCLLEARGDSLVGYLWTMNYVAAGGMTLFYNYGGNQYVHAQTVSNSVTSTTKYYHLAVSVNRSDNKIRFYVDGNQVGDPVSLQHTNSISPTGGDYYHIGYDRGGTPWFGDIPVFKHYNKALSNNEIQQNYQNYKTRFNL